ncbi:hypothetical protein FQB35_10185 [Crassaminicella thermophila]|uniref:Uncharacterized protein n=1 Tax=Crassaminicella thermophila TaxID=2599308 RepID=A0A5C0SFZ6_CRATE|nr:hypothetical protein [Crassaminicella thermophila]QEK12666.1 hypothetical protein FQB35_10185 [Crassaminicella thermophila]
MRNTNGLHSAFDEDVYDLIDLVEKFLEFSEELLTKELITKEIYEQITHNKIKFLYEIEKEIHLESVKIKECI